MTESKPAFGDLNNFSTALAAAKSAKIDKVDTQGERQHLILPEGFKTLDVTDPDRLDPYVTAARIFDDAASLIDYTNRFREDGAIVIADLDADKVVSLLDYHEGAGGDAEIIADVRPNRHSATLQLRPSAEWEAWDGFEKAGLCSQAEFARFLEENANDVIEPEPNRLVEIARDLEVTTDANFRSRTDLKSGNRTFHYETKDNVKGDLVIPTKIAIEIPFWYGEPVMRLEAMFRYRASGQGLMLAIQWHRVEYQRQAAFWQIANRAAEETGLPVYMGRA